MVVEELNKLERLLLTRTSLLLITAAAAVLAVRGIDEFILKIGLFREGVPDFSPIYLCRTLLIILSSWLLVRAFSENYDAGNGHQIAAIHWGRYSGNASTPSKKLFFDKLDRSLIWSMQLLSVLFLALFVYSPDYFFSFGREGNVIETLSASFWFINSIIFIRVFVLFRSGLAEFVFFHYLVCTLFAVAFFVIGMEEVSWFQRVLSIETPDFFASNLQGEMNFHNFHTDLIENAYYFSVFAFLIAFPFVYHKLPFKGYLAELSHYCPSTALLLCSASFVGYNYDMWNILPIQLAFFVTLFVVLHYFQLSVKGSVESLTTLTTALLLIVTQLVFILKGDTFVRSWDVTEYRELLIPLSFFLYGIHIYTATKNRVTTGAVAVCE